LAALIQILIQTEKPFLCSGIYAGIVFVIGLFFGGQFASVLIATAISFAFASLYFWLLDRFQNGWPFLAIAIGGLLIGLV